MKTQCGGRPRRLDAWLPACLLGAVLAFLAGQTPAADQADGEPIALTEDQQRAYGITLAAPEPAAQSLSRRYPGEVAVPNPQLRVVAATRAGVIESLLVAEGEPVRAGQALAHIASPELVGVQSDYLETLTRLDLAETELARDRQLHQEGIIAERRLLASRAHERELRTLAEQRRQMLSLSGMDAEAIDALVQDRRLSASLAVRSPIDGVVLEQMVATGQSVQAAAALYRVAKLKPLWVEIHVPVESLAGIAPATGVLLPAPGLEGRVITVGSKVHAEDQGVLVRAEVAEGSEQLRPGQFVEVQLRPSTPEADGDADGDLDRGWRVPTAAVVRSGSDARVFVAREAGFLALPVEVLAEEDRNTVVAGDLARGERIAISGVAALKAAWLAAQDEAGADDGADASGDGG